MSKTQFWSIAQLDNLEMWSATDVLTSSSRHTHETLTLATLEKGTAFLDCKGERYPLAPGCVAVINPDDVHACHAESVLGYSQSVIYPSLDWLERATAEVTARQHILPLFEQPILEDCRLYQQVRLLFETLTNSNVLLEQETRLLTTLICLIQNHSKVSSSQIRPIQTESSVIRQVRDYLEERYAENISLSELATLTYLSPFHLNRMFCQAVGLPPHLYLTQVRVLQAKKRLAQGMEIARVALEVGFAHQSHLHRHFKKMVGVTPKQYQNSKNVQERVHENPLK